MLHRWGNFREAHLFLLVYEVLGPAACCGTLVQIYSTQILFSEYKRWHTINGVERSETWSEIAGLIGGEIRVSGLCSQ
jgi:hypothetical protein